mmetsp:Transcript_16384/g.33322  ORF Transcript_16384/g.33322 Transcript_16384/m.33322 type:complete len:105 (-) Transcript_16384:928-1242(-)
MLTACASASVESHSRRLASAQKPSDCAVSSTDQPGFPLKPREKSIGSKQTVSVSVSGGQSILRRVSELDTVWSPHPTTVTLLVSIAGSLLSLSAAGENLNRTEV